MKSRLVLSLFCVLVLGGCAVESHTALQTRAPKASQSLYKGEKPKVSVGRFNNQSSYQNGIFSNGDDRLGNQATTILLTSLQESGRFIVVERSNMQNLKQESDFANKPQKISGAKFIITGDITGFGRKVIGDKQLWGIVGKGKTQVAYANVSLNVVNVQNSEIVFAAQGAGEYALSSREILGTGSSGGYDSTLNSKVLSLAITEAVDKIAIAIEDGLIR